MKKTKSVANIKKQSSAKKTANSSTKVKDDKIHMIIDTTEPRERPICYLD